MRMFLKGCFGITFLVFSALIAPIHAQELELISVSVKKEKAQRGDVFETRLEVNTQTPDVSTNLLINGKEYFGNQGGGACRSDGQLFAGWLLPESSSVSNPTVRILCTVPLDTPDNAIIEVVGFQFRNCEGPSQPDGSVRCKVIKAPQKVMLESDPADTGGDDPVATDEPSTDTTQQIEGRIIDQIYALIFGQGGGSGSRTSPTPGEAGNEPAPQSPEQPFTPSTSVANLSSCIAQKQGGAQERYERHLPYILTETQRSDLSLQQTAYVLATAKHETGSFQFLTELGSDAYLSQYNGRSDLCNVIPNDGPRFRGRGYVQLTGRCNYTKYTAKELRVLDPAYQDGSEAQQANLRPIINRYDDYSSVLSTKANLLANPTYIVDDLRGAGGILVGGMDRGLFTGKKLPDYINSSSTNYTEARRTVNGMDKASQIAGYARTFEDQLRSCNSG